MPFSLHISVKAKSYSHCFVIQIWRWGVWILQVPQVFPTRSFWRFFMLLTFVLHVADVSCELYCGHSLACMGYWSLQALAKFNRNVRKSLMPRLGRALWKGCSWLPVVAVLYSLLPIGPIFSTKEKLMWIHCDLLGRIVFAIIQSVLLDNNHNFQHVTCITENTLRLAFNIMDANESIQAGRQQKPINRKPSPLILQCGISAALLTCFQTMPPFAGTALSYPVSLAVCISCFESHEDTSYKQCPCSQVHRHNTGMWCTYHNIMK